MSDRAEIEKILREAGLQENATQECLTIFEKERITSNVLPRLSVGDLRDMGIVTGDRRLLFDHLHPNSPSAEGASAPPPPEAAPICEQHNQPISGLCTQPRCQYSLVCNDCMSVGDHQSHKAADGLKAIDVLRSRLEQWEPSTILETQIRQQQEKVSCLRSQLVKEELELNKLQQQQQVQTNANARITQSLSRTKNMSPGPDALHALKELRELVCCMQDILPPTKPIRFTEIVGLEHEHDHLQITGNGTQARCITSVDGEHRRIGVIDPRPINSGSWKIEWTVYPQSNSWVGFGVLPVDSTPKLQTKDAHALFYGWSANHKTWSDGRGMYTHASVDGARLRLSLDCEKHTFTLTNLDNNETSVIEGIPFPVYPFVTLWCNGNQLSVV